MPMAAFSTHLLDARVAQQRQRSERDRQRTLSAALIWLSAKGETYGVPGGYLFGSLTKPGQFSDRSDVDLAVDTLQQGDPFGLISYLSLHLNRDVDLVPLDQCHFAEKIQAVGIRWKAAKLPD